VFGVTVLNPVGVAPIIALMDTAIRNPKTINIARKLYDEKSLFHKLTTNRGVRLISKPSIFEHPKISNLDLNFGE
jgi:hypothetical protein